MIRLFIFSCLLCLGSIGQTANAQIFDKMEKALDKLTGAVSENKSVSPRYSLETEGNTKGITLELESVSKSENDLSINFKLIAGKTPYSSINIDCGEIEVLDKDSEPLTDILVSTGKIVSTKNINMEVKSGKKYNLKVRVLNFSKQFEDIKKITLPFTGEGENEFSYTFDF